MITLLAPALASARWRALGVDVQVTVDRPDLLDAARALLAEELAALDLACSRFRADSEVLALERAGGRPLPVSRLLADAVRTALVAAEQTDGALDPTLGSALRALGYDRDLATLPPEGPPVRVQVRRRPSWREVAVHPSGVVRVPAGVLLDLGATAKALGADRAAARLADALGCAVLVNLGGDLAVRGDAPAGGWAVRVQDCPEPGGPAETVAVSSGAMATSSTVGRSWLRGGQRMHHLVDPVTSLPSTSPWRTVSVTADTCVAANTASTATLVKGADGLDWLRGLGLPARLVAHDGSVLRLAGWPRP